jgi:hypothetical protein
MSQTNRARRWTRLAVLIIAISTCFCAPVNATTIVVMRTGDGAVIIAADGLAIQDDVPVPCCKIQNTGSVWVAISGPAFIGQFNAFQIANQSILQSKNIHGAVEAFIKAIPELFAARIMAMKTGNPKEYARITSEPEPLEVAFAAIEDGIPKYVIVRFTISDNADRTIAVTPHYKSCPGSACPSKTTDAQFLGENEAAKRRFNKPDIKSSNDAFLVSRKLIESEIAARPEKVGPPISIVAIAADGPHWKFRGECK